MNVHDWSRVRVGLFHNFHRSWITRLLDALNEGGLPEGYCAMADQRVGDPVPDVIAYRDRTAPPRHEGGVATAVSPPRAWRSAHTPLEAEVYARRAHRIINAYSLAFFNRHLMGRPAVLLDGPAELYPEVLFETRRP